MLNKIDFANILLPFGEFHSIPNITKRDWWEKNLTLSQKFNLYNNATLAQLIPWPELSASRYLDFHRNGNRNRYEELYFQRRSMLWNFVIGECIKNNGSYIDNIINAIWSICEESSWCIPAHISAPAYIGIRSEDSMGLPVLDEPIIDLFSADTSSLLAHVYYMLHKRLDQESLSICQRIKREITLRIINPFLERDDFWWMGLLPRKINNWNPWIISNIVPSILYIEEDQERRIAAIGKCMECIDRYIAVIPEDGGCDEGPNYWGVAGGAIFDILEQIYNATSGNVNRFAEIKIRNILEFFYKVFIHDSYYVNFADGPATLYPDAFLICAIGLATDNTVMEEHGRYCIHNNEDSLETKERYYSPFRWFRQFRPELKEGTAKPAYLKSNVLPDTEVLTIRENEGSTKGFFLAVKGGHNDESHNHNDVGNFIIYFDGKPIIVDAGVGEYTKNTFSTARYDIWTMQSQYHNLPMINGLQQNAGAEYKSSLFTFDTDKEKCQVEIAKAYPAEAHVKKWLRTFDFKDSEITICEEWELIENKAPTVWNFLLCNKPVEHKHDLIHIGRGIQLKFPNATKISIEEIPITKDIDQRLYHSWKAPLYRLSLSYAKIPLKGSIKFLVLSDKEV